MTGASGLLGANLVLLAEGMGIPVVGVYHRKALARGDTPMIRADLRDRESVASVFAEWRPAWIVHCAAATDVDWCEKHPDEARLLNAEVPGRIAEESAARGVGLVYVSTDAVFDGSCAPAVEEDVPAPLNVYARTKLDGEVSVREEMGSALIVRTNMFGWSPSGTRSLAEWVLSRLRAGERVPGFTDVLFNPLEVNDLGAIILDLLREEATGLYHVAADDRCSKFDFARRLASAFGFSEDRIDPVSLDAVDLAAPRPRDTTLAVEKLAGRLGTRPPRIEEGIDRLRTLWEGNRPTELGEMIRQEA